MSTAHVHFREGQILRAADLAAEQRDRLEGWQRHTRALHQWGIAFGLELRKAESDLEGIVVAAGLAVDGWGRALVLPNELLIPADRLDEVAAVDGVSIWLQQKLTSGGTNGGSARGDRLEACVVLLPPSQADVLASQPSWIEPADPAPPWPIYLGTVDSTTGEWQPKTPDPLVYVEPVGSTVRSPQTDLEIQLAGEGSNDQGRFAISTIDPAGVKIDRFAVESSGRARLKGPVTIKPPASTIGFEKLGSKEWNRDALELLAPETADLIVDSACADTARSLRLTRPGEAPKAARPWSLSHIIESANGTPGTSMRVELPNPGKQGNASALRLAIGHSSKGEDDNTCAFEPCVTVSSDCSLRIAGNLIVAGRIVQSPIQPSQDDPRFAAAMLEAQIAMLFDLLSLLGENGPSDLPVELEISDGESATNLICRVTIDDPEVNPIVFARITIDGRPRPAQQATQQGGAFVVSLARPQPKSEAVISVVAIALQTEGGFLLGTQQESLEIE